MTPTPPGSRPFAVLRGLVRQRPPGERCELCSAGLGADHPHLVEPATSQALCCCEACAILFDGRPGTRYRRVPRRVEYWPDFRMTDAQWESLNVPIGLAFFFFSSPAGRVVALYPSLAGPAESLLTLEVWRNLEADNPSLRELEPDVEALLVNRVGAVRDYYHVPLDECYQLVGLIRIHWRGLSGSAEVWEAIRRFFISVKQKSALGEEASHA